MRKWIIMLIAALFIQLLPAVAGAASGALTASIDQSDRKVVIEGRLAEPGAEVLVTVTDPNGRLDYFNQKTTDETGAFRFSYVSGSTTAGIYRVRAIGPSGAGGNDLQAEYTYTGSATNGNEPGTGAVSPSADVEIVLGADGTVVLKPRLTRDPVNGGLYATIGSEALKRAMELATPDSGGMRHLLIQAKSEEPAKAYRIALPAAALSMDSKSASITLDTPMAAVTVPSDMLAAEGASVAEFAIEEASRDGWNEATSAGVGNRPAVDIALKLDGKPVNWRSESSQVDVTIPYAPALAEQDAEERLIVRYVDDSGQSVPILNSRYKDGKVSFRTPHFSTYAVAFGGETFMDLPVAHWAHQAVGALAARGIVQGRTDGSFAPAASVTRAEFLTLLTRTLELRADDGGNISGELSFKDVSSSAYYAPALRAAAKAGVVKGDGSGNFRPSERISRQELSAMVYRALVSTGRLATAESQAASIVFKDESEIAAYARDSVKALADAGIMQGSNDAFRPAASASRAEAAQVMYKIWFANAE
ncbi:S-layer homology domain-containing protein [Cohnella hashimotonis]|uniref:S-layer homology domain-containing protein n=1 Tax=Cohnella hashimotonis TaxID=2826895 RepID=A0ABT6TES7_9BACL|nr:S-layer homology domain-containing protein [Cohnella hashimotonis]MDI4644469.1 S-layer homology domain-containing protein [Cohnella hashimotonis]